MCFLFVISYFNIASFIYRSLYWYMVCESRIVICYLPISNLDVSELRAYKYCFENWKILSRNKDRLICGVVMVYLRIIGIVITVIIENNGEMKSSMSLQVDLILRSLWPPPTKQTFAATRTIVDWAARLVECIAPLNGQGFPVATWDVEAPLRTYVTTPNLSRRSTSWRARPTNTSSAGLFITASSKIGGTLRTLVSPRKCTSYACGSGHPMAPPTRTSSGACIAWRRRRSSLDRLWRIFSIWHYGGSIEWVLHRHEIHSS